MEAVLRNQELLKDVTFSILDTETTGLSAARGARVCEVAILQVCGGKRIGMFQTLVKNVFGVITVTAPDGTVLAVLFCLCAPLFLLLVLPLHVLYFLYSGFAFLLGTAWYVASSVREATKPGPYT